MTNDHIMPCIKALRKLEATREKLKTVKQAEQVIESKLEERRAQIQRDQAACDAVEQEIKREEKEFAAKEGDDRQKYDNVLSELHSLRQKKSKGRR